MQLAGFGVLVWKILRHLWPQKKLVGSPSVNSDSLERLGSGEEIPEAREGTAADAHFSGF